MHPRVLHGTWCRDTTSPKPKQCTHPLSTIFASGEAPSTGQLFDTTNPLLKTATGVFWLNMNF